MTASAILATDRIPVQRIGKSPEGEHSYIRVSELVGAPAALGDVPGALSSYVGTYEEQAFRRTRLVLTNMPIALVSVTTGRGMGGTKVYDFPAGFIKRLGCRARLTVSIPTAYQADYTDSTPEGDIGIGTVVPANADALGTDATDDDWGTAIAANMTAYATSVIAVASEADGVHDGSATPIDLCVNFAMDAADIDDGVTTSLVVNGTIWFSWLNQGGEA